MYYFSDNSQRKLNTCHSQLILLANQIIKVYDIIVLYGHRGQEEQDRLYNDGKSDLKYPDSYHNIYPSRAIDIAPYPIDWNDLHRFYYLGGLVEGISKQLGLKIEWGGNWNTRKDYVHFQLV